ncbi:MAG: hypothetical protein RL398_3362 [Planctomycetota bacterium]
MPGSDLHYPSRRGEGETGNPFVGALVDGKYRLQAVLGRGGLGTVFQAQHIGSLLPVAIKLLHPRFAEQREYRSGLLAEARRAASVLHDRCARLLDVGETEDGMAYLAMELVHGDTLEAVADGAPLPPGHVAAILLQVTEALVAIHGAGFVHCDLSPRNVMVNADAVGLRVKVLDFGIARTVSLRGGDRTTRTEVTGFFNPVFSAPELLAGRDVDARADFYSLGMLARLLLLGSLPAGRERHQLDLPRGVPRRLVRLVDRCLQEDPAARPADARTLLAELRQLLGARQPLLGRVAVAAAGAVALANLLLGGEEAVFLRTRAGSPLTLQLPGGGTELQHRRSAQLHTLGLYFGGFSAAALQLEVSREGAVLLRRRLDPEVEDGGETLVLSVAQAGWREALDAVTAASRDGPVDLSFVAPGRGAVAVARVRVDDRPPTVVARLSSDGVLRGDSVLRWEAADDVGLAAAEAVVRWPGVGESRVPLQVEVGELALGAQLAERYPAIAAFGPVEVQMVVTDRAGNVAAVEPLRVPTADLAAPAAVEVLGAGGEPFVPRIGGVARLRVRRAAIEPGCTLEVRSAAGTLVTRAACADDSPWTDLEIAAADGAPFESGAYTVAVIDAVGNRAERTFGLQVRERDLGLRLTARGDLPALYGAELVVGAQGTELVVACAGGRRLAGAAFVAEVGVAAPVLAVVREGEQTVLRIAPTAAGVRRLQLTFEDLEAPSSAPLRVEVPTRILPETIELNVPEAPSRFLPSLLAAGVLARGAQGLVEGPGWRVDADLVGYLRGNLWVGADALAPEALPQRGATLLPEVTPLPGRNVLAVAIEDVLGRPVRVLVGGRRGLEVPVVGGRAVVVADFLWHDAGPEPIGEVVLVEHAQPARIWLRLPLAYREEDAPLLRLGIGQAELPAAAVVAAADGCAVRFDVPVAVWGSAAGFGDLAREEFAAGRERNLGAYLATPLGRDDLQLSLRTARSTLRPLALRDLGPVAPGLAALTLLPVLAPDRPFAEPLAAAAPPRALFRAQSAVAVRNLGDLLLQQREFTVGQARALLAALPSLPATLDRAELVHADDPLGRARIAPSALLPEPAGDAEAPLVGVDFFQAYAACRTLGVVVGGDPELFRLPFGCELELAAFGAGAPTAAYAAASGGKGVSMDAFVAAAASLAAGRTPDAAAARAAGDFVVGNFGADFVGLDFGVREWVFDLPHAAGVDLLLREWRADHAQHRQRVEAFARGAVPPLDLVAALRTFGIVHGLALGELDGLLDSAGERVTVDDHRTVPPSVPGVIRAEQLRRDGRDLLSARSDPRLARTGFRVAAGEALLLRWRGRS